jgi:hypothetical protein
MTDHSKRLHDLLEQLHHELEAAEDLDAQAEQDLRAAMHDIRAKLADGEPIEADEVEQEIEEIDNASRHHGTLSEAAREFSASHPLLARTIGQLADILGQSGI